MIELPLLKNLLLATIITALFTWELLFPYFTGWKHKLRHLLRNGTLILFNYIILQIILIGLLLYATNNPYGLFSTIMFPIYIELLLTILLIDLLTYGLHVWYHKNKHLWKLHRVHHSDTHMDITTGARFHIGEHLISFGARLILFYLFAMKLEYILIYELLFIANVLFHHSNISISEPLDKIYRIFFTSPHMHKLHHSNKQKESDTNYTSLLSLWDYLFKTYKKVDNPHNITYGVQGLENEQTFSAMMKTPFKK